MSEKIWSFEELAYHAKSEDPEVRFWAVERLVHDYPDKAAGTIAILLLDDHDQTPIVVAEHLGKFGDAEHVAILTRAFRRMGGQTPGLCFEALTHLGFPGAVALARGALEKSDLSAPTIGMILESLAELEDAAAHDLVRETLERRVELLVEPAALRALLIISETEDFASVVANLARALQWRGLGQAGELFRAITDDLEADDCGWCVRTGPDGRMDLKKTIRAIESAYDCEILLSAGPSLDDTGSRGRGDLESALKAERARGMSREVARELTLRLRSGDPIAVETGLEAFIRAKAPLVPRAGKDDLPDRIAAFAAAIAGPEHRADADRLGPAYHQWVISALLSAAIKLVRYRNYKLEVEDADQDLEALLGLLEEETAFLSEILPPAIALAAKKKKDRDRAIEVCVRLLDSRGPFFPKVTALETLGALKAEDQVPEILDYLADDNSYIYTAAEKALGEMGESLVPAVRGRIQAGALDPESAESVVMLLSRLGTRGAHELATSQIDFFLDTIGPGSAAEWLGLLGSRDLLEPLRKLLSRDPARVGQAVLLLAGIHNVRIPEEAAIRAAIEDFWRKQDGDGDGDGDDDGSSRYIM